MKSEIETVSKPSGILIFGIVCVATGVLASLTMTAWGFTAYLV